MRLGVYLLMCPSVCSLDSFSLVMQVLYALLIMNSKLNNVSVFNSYSRTNVWLNKL